MDIDIGGLDWRQVVKADSAENPCYRLAES